MLNDGFNDLWPTTVYLGKIEKDINNQLCEKLFSEVDFEDVLTNFQKLDILNEGSEIFKTFRDTIVWPTFINYLNKIDIDINDFPDRRLRSWITGAFNGYMIPIHNHNGSVLSAVFYIMCEESNRGGELVLLDSRINANRGYKDQFKKLFENKIYTPKSAEYLIFPSHVYHHTIPFSGNIRLAIPVDLFL
jgi:hypothetical protein